jgi:hypothetical protein
MDVDQAAKAMRDEEMMARTSSKASISRPIEACGSMGSGADLVEQQGYERAVKEPGLCLTGA